MLKIKNDNKENEIKIIKIEENNENELVEFELRFDNFKKIQEEKNLCGGNTEHGIYIMLRNLIETKKIVDTIIIFSDCQIGEGCNWYGIDESTRQTFNQLMLSLILTDLFAPQISSICGVSTHATQRKPDSVSNLLLLWYSLFTFSNLPRKHNFGWKIDGRGQLQH